MAKRYASVRRDDGTMICERCLIADGLLSRMRGLLGRRELPAGDGILLRPASSIHMLFMRFAIDAIFVSRDLTVLRVVHDLAPWRVAAKRGAHAVFELPAGTCERLGVYEGHQLAVDD